MPRQIINIGPITSRIGNNSPPAFNKNAINENKIKCVRINPLIIFSEPIVLIEPPLK